MRYVDAGYVIALGVLALYALSLLARRRRLERAAARGSSASATARDVAAPGTVDAHDIPVVEGAPTRDLLR
ncbi:MAG: hypothetical protein ACRDXC_11220 [Acidimicrobiales bacterium]